MYEKLLERRSVRKYKPEQVTDELLDAVLKAGLYAPTAKNNQKPVMVAVRDKETRDLLSKINAEIMDVETDPFYGAPCVIVVLAAAGSTAPVRPLIVPRVRHCWKSGACRNATAV